MADAFKDAIDDMLRQIPRKFLEQRIATKLKESNIEATPERLEMVSHAILSGEHEFELDGVEPEAGVIITFNDNDLAELEKSINEFCRTKLPEILSRTASEGAKGICKTLKKEWPKQRALQDGEIAQFSINLDLRWGEAVEAYRMLLTVSRELGESYHTKLQKSRSKRNLNKRHAINRLHARACCVSDEILALLKAGFADGAMARWRTLHEIGIVCALIAEHDDELAERYLLHDVVEAKKALELYENTYAELGYRPPSKRESDYTRKAYDELRNRFGKSFCAPYGWAALHLGTDGMRFSDLEKAANRSQMRSHYKMASYNVHAGIKGITDQLGLLENWSAILAGRSNAGLDEPGQNAAISLTQVSVLLLLPSQNIDSLVSMKVLCELRDKAVKAFVKAGRKLKREDKELRRSILQEQRAWPEVTDK